MEETESLRARLLMHENEALKRNKAIELKVNIFFYPKNFIKIRNMKSKNWKMIADLMLIEKN